MAHTPRGSLADPEVYENVPGHVIPILEREFDDFDTQAGRFLAGETPEDQFIGFRLKQGVYGQRQIERQMVRVKLPFGGINPEQMEAFADAVERWVPLRKGHITTRQNIQMHHVPLVEAEKLIREIGESGSPSMWITRSSLTNTRCPQPTAQYGQTDLATRSAVTVRASRASDRFDLAERPSPSGSPPSCRTSGGIRRSRIVTDGHSPI